MRDEPDLEKRVHLAILRLMAGNGLAPVREEELRFELPDLAPDELALALELLRAHDVVRELPEGWVLRSHGPKQASTNWRLLLRT